MKAELKTKSKNRKSRKSTRAFLSRLLKSTQTMPTTLPTPQPRTTPQRAYRTPEKRSLGRIALFPSAYQCGWLGRNHLVFATIAPDSTTLHTDEGDCFEGVGHWVQAEQRRELMRLQMENLMHKMDDTCPDTPALFRSQNNELPTVEENEPSLMTDLTDLMNSVDTLEIEINQEDRDIYDDDEIDGEGFDLDSGSNGAYNFEADDTDTAGGESLHASLGRRWKHIDLDDEEDRISPRSIVDMRNGGERVMNFDMMDVVEHVEEREEEEEEEEEEDVEEIDTDSARAMAISEFIKGKGKELLQQSLSNPIPQLLQMSMKAAPMVIASSVTVTPLEMLYADENNENDDENNDAVAAALKIFKNILNGADFSRMSSPQKEKNGPLVNNRTSPILVGGRH